MLKLALWAVLVFTVLAVPAHPTPAHAADRDIFFLGRLRINLDCRSQTVTVRNEGRLAVTIVEVNRYRAGREDLRFPRVDDLLGGRHIVYRAGVSAPARGLTTLLPIVIFEKPTDGVVIHIETGVGAAALGTTCARGNTTREYLREVTQPLVPDRLVELPFKLTVNGTRPQPGYFVEYTYPVEGRRSNPWTRVNFCPQGGRSPCSAGSSVYWVRVLVPRGADVRYSSGLWDGGPAPRNIGRGRRVVREGQTVAVRDHTGPSVSRRTQRAQAQAWSRINDPVRTFQLTVFGDVPPGQGFGLEYHELFGTEFCGVSRPCAGGGTTYSVNFRAYHDGDFPYRFSTSNQRTAGGRQGEIFRHGFGSYPNSKPITASYTFPGSEQRAAPIPGLPNTGGGGLALLEANHAARDMAAGHD